MFRQKIQRSRPWQSLDQVSTTIKITGLPELVTEENLKRFVWQHSADRGLIRVSIFKGYALLNYTRETSSDIVCSKLNGRHYNGSAIRAKIKGAKPAPSECFTVKINRLSPNVSEEELRNICSRFGIVTSIKLNEGFAYINFSDLTAAQSAIDYLNKVTLCGQTISAKMHHQPQDRMSLEPQIPVYTSIGASSRPCPMPSSTSLSIYHSQLPSCHSTASQPLVSSTVKVELSSHGISGSDLRHYFMKFGHVEGVPVIRSGKPDYAYVNFFNSEDAVNACKEAVVQLKAVTLTIKLSNKPRFNIPKVDTQSFVADDSIVNQLLAKDCFNELEKKLAKFNVTIKPLEAFTGLQITGSHEDVVKAKILLDAEVDILKGKITKKSKSFPCSAIPFFSDPKFFQDVQQKHSTEFSLLRNDGSEETLVLFCASISSYSKRSTPMKLALFDDYFNAAESEQVAHWCFQDDFNQFAEMSHQDSQAVECLYQSFKNCSASVLAAPSSSIHLIGKFLYSYDFSRMVQENMSTRKTRPLKRKVMGSCQTVAREITIQCRGLEANVATSLHELREAVDKMSSTVTVKVENIENETLKIAREYCVEVERLPGTLSLKGDTEYVRKVSFHLKEKIVEVQSSCTAEIKGPYWESQSDKIEIKDVNLRSEEGLEIKREFGRTLPSSKVIKIQRIQNKWLWEKYVFCRQRMSSKNGKSGVNEKRLFHGSSQTPPEDIYRSDFGFDFRFGTPGKWGKGAYFASDSNYSNSYAFSDIGYQQNKQMFLAYVLTGYSVTLPGNSSLDKPPLKPLSTERYDSVTNGHSGATQIFVVYDHDKSYPAYIITYR